MKIDFRGFCMRLIANSSYTYHKNQFSAIGIFRWLSLSKPSTSLAFSYGRFDKLNDHFISKLVVEKYRADEN